MVVPAGASDYPECLRIGTEVFHALKKTLHEKGLSTAGGDEGGFAPDLESNRAALDFLLAAIESAGYAPGVDVSIAMDPATSELFNDGGYVLDFRVPLAVAGGDGRLLARPRRTASRSSRSRTAWTRRTGTAGSSSPSAWPRTGRSWSATTSSSPTPSGSARHRAGGGELDPDQGQPDRHPDRDPRGDPDRSRRRLHDGHLAPLRRNRGHDHRRPRRRHRRGPDQDRRPVALGPDRQVQPPAPHRRRAGRVADLPGASVFTHDRRWFPMAVAGESPSFRTRANPPAAQAAEDAVRSPGGTRQHDRTSCARKPGEVANAYVCRAMQHRDGGAEMASRVRWDRVGAALVLVCSGSWSPT